ncbi:hypothetical protein [Actinomadura harenae]|uniref:Uncharacterized protein n=1 Tax=Actinomadura harenae TaxID=2483351 RepID=A0A3M2MFD3_9ACTN|nr:hypothetical protein [Actinomadura harenae]RMI47583.1 hypothetical protein EBO15_01395 [Actinomadura harenae]
MTIPIDPETGEIQVRPFADVLRDLGRAVVIDEAAVQLQQLATTVKETGKKGRMVLTVEIQPMKGNESALMVHAKTDLKLPSSEPIGGVFFPDQHGNLLRDDPRQIAIPLREITRPHTEKDLKQA